MPERLKGIVSDDGAAFEPRSERPELTAPASQSYLPQEVMQYAPCTEGSLDTRTIVLKLRWNKSRR